MNFKEDFLEKLNDAKKVVFFTGAGISAESGIPTFRGKDGIWNKLKPEELASFDAFMRNPDMVWEWYQYRRSIINDSKPNAGHLSIVEFEKYYDTQVVTQNVDNLHGRAGSKTIHELHGNIERNYCIDCKHIFNLPDEINISNKVPRCKKCGGLVRPDVVWFGEMLPQQTFTDAEKAAEECDICFVAGTSAIVYPAAYIPMGTKQTGGYVVEVNIERTEFSRHADYSIYGKTGEVLPKVLEAVANLKGSAKD